MDTLKILVVAIAAALLLYIAYGYFQMDRNELRTEIVKGIDYAEGLDGKTHTKNFFLQENFALNAENLDTPTRSVRFECQSVETCGKKIVLINTRSLTIKQSFSLPVHFRCAREAIISDCVVYFGNEPPQIEIVEFASPAIVSAGKEAEFSFSAKNSGGGTSLGSEYEIKIYARTNRDGKTIDVLKNEARGEIESLVNGKSGRVVENFTIGLPGEYVAKLSVFGDDSGMDFSEVHFEVRQNESSCTATSKGATYINENGVCQTEYFCSGCDIGPDCLLAWTKSGLDRESAIATYANRVEMATDTLECK